MIWSISPGNGVRPSIPILRIVAESPGECLALMVVAELRRLRPRADHADLRRPVEKDDLIRLILRP
ncbi:hypothetical protein [Pseudonocardia xinjiangensis]|uniref:Uncharacterized protein n=1 Tax=Pseudonocardia xinjiangensis TaxID=75289 RepID=A0ABX1RS23_9PSEU|nr:hypothetical protein [Pseudonocardia xinjiangensis]NMH82689.1 hypothetical protein [Pseudonocardia xinjiangensis]